MKKISLVLLICVVFVLAACGVEQEAIEEKDPTAMAELTEIYDNLEDDEAKAVVKKMIDGPGTIERSTLSIWDEKQLVEACNAEACLTNDLWIKNTFIWLGDYIRFFYSHSEVTDWGSIRMHYMTVLAETENSSLMQPLSIRVYDRTVEKNGCIGANEHVIIKGDFHKVEKIEIKNTIPTEE